jgi:hypothetical protein
MATYSFTTPRSVSITKTFNFNNLFRAKLTRLVFFPIWKIYTHNTAQGGSARPDIASLIYKHFENPEPFIYEKPVDIFAPLWETPSPVAIRTKDDAARKERLSQYGTAVFDDLWRHLLVHILRCFLLGMLPFDGLSNSARSIYQERYSDLNFRKLHRPVVESWPQGARGSETLVDVVKHWFTNQLYQEVSTIPNLPSWCHAQMLTLTSGQGTRFSKLCVLRARFASQQAIEEMEVHNHHLPHELPCERTSLRAHRFSPVHRKEILTMIEESQQDLILYDPTLQDGTDESVPSFKFCTPQVLITACALFQNFSEPSTRPDSIILMALDQHNEALQPHESEGHNVFPILSVAIPSVIVSFLIPFF